MLKQGTLEDFKNCTLLNYEEWGTNLTIEQYLEREMVSKQHVSGHRPWKLVNPNDENEIYASCETYSNESLYAFKGDSKVSKGISESVASVYIEPKYRGKGYSSQLMKQLYNQFEKEGRIFCDLYSDVDPKVYSKCGWQSCPSTTLKVSISDNEKNSSFLNNNYNNYEKNSKEITEGNIKFILKKEIGSTETNLIQYVNNNDTNKDIEFAYSKIFTLSEFYWEISQAKVYSTYMNLKTPNVFGHVIFNNNNNDNDDNNNNNNSDDNDDQVKSYIIWSFDFRSEELKILKLVADNETDFKYLIKKAYDQSVQYNFKYIYAWFDQSSNKFTNNYIKSIGYEITIREGSIPMVASWIKNKGNDELLDQSKGKWINVEKFGWV